MATCCYPGRMSTLQGREHENIVARAERPYCSFQGYHDELATAFPHVAHLSQGDGGDLPYCHRRELEVTYIRSTSDGHVSCRTILSRPGQRAGASQRGTPLITWVESLLPGACGPRTELEHRSGRAGTGPAQVFCRGYSSTHHRGDGTPSHRSFSS